MATEKLLGASVSTARLLEAAEAAFITEQVQRASELFPEDRFIVEPVGSGVSAVTKPSFMWKLNHVAGLGMAGKPVPDEDLESIERRFRGINILPYINLCPFSYPGTRELLLSRGYTVSGHLTVYVLALQDYEHEDQSGIKITPVSDEEKGLFVESSVVGFQSGGRPIELLRTLAESAALRSDTRLYFAKIGGQIAGSAGLAFLETPLGRVAELYIDSTIPEFRGKGVQTALLKARLAEVKKSGVETATLSAVPGASRRNVERAGFKLAYTKETFTKVDG